MTHTELVHALIVKLMKKVSYALSFIILWLPLASESFGAVEGAKNPNSAKACAICHYRWVDTFFVEGKGTDLVEYQSEKVVAKPEMCFSCHDGSVRDSRARVFNDNGHKTNQPPPTTMKIPEIFPLDENGNMQCSTCHTAHGVASGPESDETIFMRTSNRASSMCRQCHPKRDGGIAAGNHPIGVTEQEIPGKLVALGSVSGGKKNEIVCETCHTSHGSKCESLLIESAGNSTLCLDCHDDKKIFTPGGLRKPFHVINVVPQKAKIPEELIKRGAKLGCEGVITCQTCHKVHNNKIDKRFLLVTKKKKSSLCLTCHSDKRYLVDTKHNLMRSRPEERNLEGHTVAEAGVCSACHLPHKAARKLAGGKDLTTQLCLSCHGKGNIAEKVNLSGNTHPLNVNPYENTHKNILLRATDIEKEKLVLPLFDKYGIQAKDGTMTCSTCHDTHGSQADSTKRPAGKKADNTTFFLRKQSPDICRECHSNKFTIANSKHDLKKVAPEERNILLQTPSESGLCGSCHLVHGSQKGMLWARNKITKTNGNLENYCISCHSEDSIASKKVIKNYSHPMNTSPIEKGLTSTLPLFDQSGKLSRDGLIKCQTCHDPHRWNPLKALAGDHFDMEGNSQNSFLRLENGPSPVLCENCHADKAYIEKTDHDLAVTGVSSKNIIGQSPAESGTCGVCHLVHNGKHPIMLWAQGFGRGDNVMEQMCNFCHSENGSAKDKIPLITSHPKDLIMSLGQNAKYSEDYFPVFDATSGAAVIAGDISCPSCHNVHQWNPRVHAKGKGVNLEGNATNSFLRGQSFITMCKDCHGIDSLFRFKFFHDPKERKKKNLN